MKVLAAAALVVTLAATPMPNPFTLESPRPSASAAPYALPEIGRVRSATPACAAMRDLVIPSFAAARRADARFAETTKRLPRYIEITDDTQNLRNTVFHEKALSDLDRDSTALIAEAEKIRRALSDPRLDPKSADPRVISERAQLQQLYDMQSARANLLFEFVQRENQMLQANNFGDNGALRGRNQAAPTPQPPRPLPGQSNTPLNMPQLTGLDIADKNSLNGWTSSISKAVRVSENEAAKTFYPIAQSCR